MQQQFLGQIEELDRLYKEQDAELFTCKRKSDHLTKELKEGNRFF